MISVRSYTFYLYDQHCTKQKKADLIRPAVKFKSEFLVCRIIGTP